MSGIGIEGGGSLLLEEGGGLLVEGGTSPAKLAVPPAVPVIGFPRWTPGATFTATSAADGYPAGQLGVLPLSKPWISASAALTDTRITATFATRRKINLVVLGPHNLSTAARVRVRMFAQIGDTEPVADSGLVRAWAPIYKIDSPFIDWSGGNFWSRTYTREEAAGYPWFLPLLFDSRHYVARIEIEIRDAANPDGHVRLGLVELSTALRFPQQVARESEYGYDESRVQMQQALGGTSYGLDAAKARSFQGRLELIQRDTAMGQFLELQRRHDIRVPFFWWPNPADAGATLRTAFMARHARLSRIAQTVWTLEGVQLQFIEEL